MNRYFFEMQFVKSLKPLMIDRLKICIFADSLIEAWQLLFSDLRKHLPAPDYLSFELKKVFIVYVVEKGGSETEFYPSCHCAECENSYRGGER